MRALLVFSEFFTELLQHNHITIVVAVLFITIIVAVLFISIIVTLLFLNQFKQEINKNFKEMNKKLNKNFKELRVQNQHMKTNIKMVAERLDSVTNILCKPLREIELRESNFWSPPHKSSGKSISSTESDSVKTSKTEHTSRIARSSNDRTKLLALLNINEIQCMITGIKEDVIKENNIAVGNRVLLAHIIPYNCNHKARHGLLQKYGLKPEDVTDPRNFLFLSDAFEKGFDKLQLSIVRDSIDELSIFRLKIFDEQCKNTPLFQGSNDIIGNYDNQTVNFYGHKVCQTSLSLHAQQAYVRNGSKGISPKIFVSPYKEITSLDLLQISHNSPITTLFCGDQADDYDRDTSSTVVSDLDDDDDE